MNTDFYYEIGHSHIICEDYALSGMLNPNLGFVIVSDGCSSSRDVDVGARVLAHSAKKFLYNTYAKNYDVFKNMKSSELFLPIITSANNIMKELMLEKFCLDCTLLMAISDGKETKVYAYGDGCIVVKRKDSSIEYIHIEYDEGAPYYVSYSLDDDRKKDYFQQIQQNVIIHGGKIGDGDLIVSPSLKFYEVDGIYNITSWTFTDIECITLISDGIVSYEKMHDHERISIDKAIRGVSSYKNFSGQFVERRMKSFRKECQKENVGHYDDIGVATIYIGG